MEREVERSCSRQKMKSLRLTRVMRWRSCWREEEEEEEPGEEPVPEHGVTCGRSQGSVSVGGRQHYGTTALMQAPFREQEPCERVCVRACVDPPLLSITTVE